MCHPASRLPGRQNLRSANRGQLDIPRSTVVVRCSSLRACWSISVEHSLPVHLKNRNLTLTTFMRHLKSYLFFQYWARLGCDHINALYKFTITYLLCGRQALTSPLLTASKFWESHVMQTSRLLCNPKIFPGRASIISGLSPHWFCLQIPPC